MAVVVCPGCGKRYSSINDVCPHCGADPEQAGRDRRKRRAGVGPQTHYLIAMVAAMGGAGWYYSQVAVGKDPTLAKYLIGIALIWYVAARIWAALRR